ncbi:acyltransferase family protein [Rhizobium sp.]|uniref:acyltransferase family protein n=1 Tax=Rhizobium sp. TaxID=391 RepID=UPI003F8186E5
MPRFVILDFVRFALALLVAIMHFDGFLTPRKAYLAVDFFFILSGFVLCAAYEKRAASETFFKSFVIDRIARLYPLHLLTLVLLIPVNGLFFWTTGGQVLENGWSYQDGHFYTFLLNIFMLQNVGLNTAGSWNAPAWSISVEMFVNLFLGLALIPMTRGKTVWPYLLAVAIACYAIILGQHGSLRVIYERAFGFLNLGLLRGFAGIALGVVSYQLWQWLDRKPGCLPMAKTVAASTAMASVLVMFVFTDMQNADFAMIPLMFAFVTSVAVVEKRIPLSDGLTRSVLMELGALSYGIYLCHWLILTFARYQLVYVWNAPIDFAAPETLLIFLVLVIGVSAVVHHAFELPMKARVKKWMGQGQADEESFRDLKAVFEVTSKAP